MKLSLQALRKRGQKIIKTFRSISLKRVALTTSFLLLTFLFLILLAYHLAYWHKIYPGIAVAGQPVGNQTIEAVTKKIAAKTENGESEKILLVAANQEWTLNLGELKLSYDATSTAEKAYRLGRSGQLAKDLKTKIKAWFKGFDLDLDYQFDQPLLKEQVATMAAELFIPAIEPSIQVFEATPAGALSRVAIETGKEGQTLDEPKLMAIINDQFARPAGFSQQTKFYFDPIQLPIIILSPTLTADQIERTEARAEKLLDKKLILAHETNLWELDEKALIGFLSFTDQYEEEKIASYTATLAKNVDRPAQNATFQFEGGRVTQFQPAKEGYTLEQDKAIGLIITALKKTETGEENQPRIELPVITAQPEVAVEEINNLGIKELLGRGVSSFRGSIASRVHNIQLAASRINGLLIPPGEVFSFNQALGEVSQATGFQEAYIIKEGRTILGDGGGVCQVSTTFFRAALAAGLPIIERQAHAYRVAYYEQGFPPGLDATVWEPSPDLKVKNDTPAHILIQAYVNPGAKSLTFEFYGTADGRKVTIGKSRVWDQVPPPPDLYQDDPTLPAGQVKQIDWQAWGAKVMFDWKVVRGNEVLQERSFYSNYRPWQAVFLRGTGPAQ
jgi:vancomycin resistance protein YoaR